MGYLNTLDFDILTHIKNFFQNEQRGMRVKHECTSEAEPATYTSIRKLLNTSSIKCT
jgi:hypothetical protein